MKNRFIIIYTIFASLVFAFSMCFFAYNLFNEYSTNIEKSEKKYTELVNDIRTISFNQDNNTPAYSQDIKKAVGDPADYSYIHIRRNNETVVLYPTGKSKEETVSNLTKSFNTSLTVNKQSVSVDCNIYLIRPDSIFYYARVSFLMILIITIITIIMIIYLNISENSSDVISLEEDEDISGEESDTDAEAEAEAGADAETENEISSDEEKKASLSQENHIENMFDDSDIDKEEDSEDEAESEEAEAECEPEEENKNSEVTPEEVKAIFATPLTDAQQAAEEEKKEPAKLPVEEVQPEPAAPAGLFDPETGIGWESYLFTRLDNEIDRATASEIDLSLFIIKLPQINKSTEEFKNVCNYLAIQFQFKDLLFEYKEDCIVAIKISMNVDEALTLAEKLYKDICNIVNTKAVRIGISSRSIRMVIGKRLVLEAEQAIEHSDDTAPVIAFRVDSEKYRRLMEQNQD